jgi:F-type H+-transporting ATPase subunit a
MIMHHIGDANEWEITHGFTLPLPCIPYVKGKGFQFFMSSKLKHGEVAYNGFIMDHGRLMMINEADFPMGEIQLDNGGHFSHDADGNTLLCYNNQVYHAGRHSLSKTGFSFQWLDFSITKNVTTMLLVAIIMMWIFFAVAASYKKRAGMAPSGLQNFMEPLIQFVRDDVVEPNLGDKTDKYLPYIMAVFFFIWIGNMLGQLPFIANPNLTGNITITMALALITFFLTNISGNKAYWSHIFVVPGTPIAVRPLLIVIEVAGVFIKPFALMVRLFANITAGHIIILSLTSLIFVFGNLGESIGGAVGGVALAVPFGIFMGLIELLVAFLQAFIFAILSSLFIGMAVEDHH